MGVVFDLYMFVQHPYQAATGFWDEVVNTVARESRGKKGVGREKLKLESKLKYFSASMHTCSIELK